MPGSQVRILYGVLSLPISEARNQWRHFQSRSSWLARTARDVQLLSQTYAHAGPFPGPLLHPGPSTTITGPLFSVHEALLVAG